jgi:menaquinone-dependent protoporphyrinogen oxidase
LAVAIVGGLDDARWRWWDRPIIRLIMRLTGGPTDPRLHRLCLTGGDR